MTFIISVLILFMSGCSQENPKTQNPLLRDKRIAWSGGSAQFYELYGDGSFITVGGDYPVEGYKGATWESIDEKGSYKIVPDPDIPQTFMSLTMEKTISNGTLFTLESVIEGKKVDTSDNQQRITKYEILENKKLTKPVRSEATSKIFRYANDIYVLELLVRDRPGIIKKILSEGDMITTEVMVTNSKKWMNSPPIILPKGWKSSEVINSTLTILYHDGETDTATFSTSGYTDKRPEVFEDDWF
ncbi:MAG: hypothetical protein GY705_07060 [Bacteroidetes bacterium]|nr:hypothetical protein [Bacteroidota bacterium]